MARLFETRRAPRLAGSSLWVTERSTQRSLVRRAELRRMDAGLSTRASWASRTLTNSAEMSEKVADPYSVVLKRKKFPMG